MLEGLQALSSSDKGWNHEQSVFCWISGRSNASQRDPMLIMPLWVNALGYVNTHLIRLQCFLCGSAGIKAMIVISIYSTVIWQNSLLFHVEFVFLAHFSGSRFGFLFLITSWFSKILRQWKPLNKPLVSTQSSKSFILLWWCIWSSLQLFFYGGCQLAFWWSMSRLMQHPFLAMAIAPHLGFGFIQVQLRALLGS